EEFLLASGLRSKTALAAGPVTGHDVEQRQGQSVCFEPLGDGFGRVLVGKQKLDRLKAGARGGVEPVEKPDLLEHHAEIGGEARHGWLLVCRWRGGGLLLPFGRADARRTGRAA